MLKTLLPALVATSALMIIPQLGFSETTCSADEDGCNPSLIPVRVITKDTTLNIPGVKLAVCGLKSLETIQDALSCMNGYQIADDATVSIVMKESPKSDYDTINVRHANGDRINIIGDCDGKACTIQFKPKVNGVVVENNHALGLLTNFKLQGAEGGDGSYGVGVLVNDSSKLTILGSSSDAGAPAIEITGFGDGISVNFGAGLISDASVNVHENSGTGMVVTQNASVRIPGIQLTHNTYGAFLSHSGSAVLTNALISNNNSYGLYAAINSMVDIREAKVIGNGGTGLSAFLNSSIYANGKAISSGNGKADLDCNNGAIIFGVNQSGTVCGSA